MARRTNRVRACYAALWWIWGAGVAGERGVAEQSQGGSRISSAAGRDRQVLRDQTAARIERGDAGDFRVHGRGPAQQGSRRRSHEVALRTIADAWTAGREAGSGFGD